MVERIAQYRYRDHRLFDLFIFFIYFLFFGGKKRDSLNGVKWMRFEK